MKLTMCRGLPGSGKTTWALNQLAGGINRSIRVNKDDLRAELGQNGWVWSQANEQEIIALRDSRIANALKLGFDCISDDTNFARKHKVQLEVIARLHGAQFEIRDFTNVSVDECIRRDALRPASVGRKVIEQMAAKYLSNVSNAAGPVAYARFAHVGKQDVTLPAAIICDLDGTLADFKTPGHRGPYDATLCAQDALVEPVYRLIHAMHYKAGYKIIYLSGRERKFIQPTFQFLMDHSCPEWSLPTLLMRETGDKLPDWIVKGELFDAHIRGKYYVDFVLDDRDQVVNFWRHIGLTCFQVAPGAF